MNWEDLYDTPPKKDNVELVPGACVDLRGMHIFKTYFDATYVGCDDEKGIWHVILPGEDVIAEVPKSLYCMDVQDKIHWKDISGLLPTLKIRNKKVHMSKEDILRALKMCTNDVSNSCTGCPYFEAYRNDCYADSSGSGRVCKRELRKDIISFLNKDECC